jgi:hypothetical protein
VKNIQVIDGALNCTFSKFQATEEEFALLFPEPRQDIQYAEAAAGHPSLTAIAPATPSKRAIGLRWIHEPGNSTCLLPPRRRR